MGVRFVVLCLVVLSWCSCCVFVVLCCVVLKFASLLLRCGCGCGCVGVVVGVGVSVCVGVVGGVGVSVGVVLVLCLRVLRYVVCWCLVVRCIGFCSVVLRCGV